MNNDREWLLQLLEKEGDGIMSVGGLANQLAREEAERDEPMESTRRLAFAKLVELSRRKRRLTVPQLAEKADVDTDELLALSVSVSEVALYS